MREVNNGVMYKMNGANDLNSVNPKYVVVNENIMRIHAYGESKERALLIAAKMTRSKGTPFNVYKCEATVRPENGDAKVVNVSH